MEHEMDTDQETGKETKVFTQEELNALVGEARRKSRENAAEDLLKQMGVGDIEQAKAIISAAKDAEMKNASELEKAQKRLAEAEAKAAGADTTIAQFQLTASIEKALVREGLSVEAAERVRKLVDVSQNDVDEIKSSIAQLKKDMPNLFTNTVAPTPSTNPGAPPAKEGKPGDPTGTALQALYERHPHLKK